MRKPGSPRKSSKEAPGRKVDNMQPSEKKEKKQREAPGLRGKHIETVAKHKKEVSRKRSIRKSQQQNGATESTTDRDQSKKGVSSQDTLPVSKGVSSHSRVISNSPKAGAGNTTNSLLPGGESTPRRSTQEATNAPTSNYSPAKEGYKPPLSPSSDSIDDLIQRVDNHGEDKYDFFAPAETSRSGAKAKLLSMEGTDMSVDQMTSRQPQPTIQPPAVRPLSGPLRIPVSEMTSQSYDGTVATNYSELQPPSQTSQSRRDVMSMSTMDSEQYLNGDALWSDDEFVVVKQRIAFLCIAISAVQLGILLIQLILCGVASVDVNPMIGPFPDAFSEWGGKNAYLMIEGKQYFRIITPVFLHVGILHLLVNVFCQLETCAFFEREWGSARWLILYTISGIGSVATSSVASPDIIGVCSSGALMGLFGAKIAQVISWTAFELRNSSYHDFVQLDQLGGVMCSAALVSILSFFTYIDWSSHMGGLAAGFLGGMLVFSKPIDSLCVRILWGGTGLLGLLGGASLLCYLMLYEIAPDEDLADACSYFRNLYPEGYDCECVWN